MDQNNVGRTTRIAMTAQLRPEMIDTYLALHRSPDPAIRKALQEEAHRDYRIFRTGTLLVATFEYTGDDLDAQRTRLRARAELADWMARTAECQEPVNGRIWTLMDEVFRNA